MGMSSLNSIVTYLSPPLDSQLCTQLLTEFLSMENRFVLRDWEPSTLDGGQFAEAAARILYHIDSANLSTRKSVHNCLKYVEDAECTHVHRYPDRKSALHTARVIRSIYKFRSDRGAVHIDPEYSANELDARLVLENGRWVLSEILRVFWSGDRSIVASAIRQIIHFQAPAVGDFDGHLLLQRTDCTSDEEVLIILHYAGEAGLSRSDLGRFVRASPSSISKSIKKLGANQNRQVTQLQNDNYCLTALGILRVNRDLGPKLTL